MASATGMGALAPWQQREMEASRALEAPLLRPAWAVRKPQWSEAKEGLGEAGRPSQEEGRTWSGSPSLSRSPPCCEGPTGWADHPEGDGGHGAPSTPGQEGRPGDFYRKPPDPSLVLRPTEAMEGPDLQCPIQKNCKGCHPDSLGPSTQCTYEPMDKHTKWGGRTRTIGSFHGRFSSTFGQELKGPLDAGRLRPGASSASSSHR